MATSRRALHIQRIVCCCFIAAVFGCSDAEETIPPVSKPVSTVPTPSPAKAATDQLDALRLAKTDDIPALKGADKVVVQMGPDVEPGIVREPFTISDPMSVSVGETDRYPNEVAGYRFYSSATWRTLIPLKSTMADVRRVLGVPVNCSDIANYMSPYPGDQKAVQPVWTYDLNDEWEILVYFVKSSVLHRRVFDRSLYDTLYSIDYIPREPFRFDLAKLPPRFVRRPTMAADASWDEYSDGSGLVYAVYTSSTQWGGDKPGDLNRIIYGPPQELIPNQRSETQPPADDSSRPGFKESGK